MLQKFIRRPVLAIVISIVIVFLGVLAIESRPISQFPQIAPPVVSVTISYPGASAQVLVEAALIPIERSINGVPGMRYLTSDATSAGEATIQVVFEPGTDPNIAVVNVKNRVDPVMSLLPELVRLEGVVVTPVQPSMLMYVNLYSTDPNADETFLYNFANVHLVPELQRISGLGRVTILGNRQYAMRIWLRPDRMRAYNVSIDDVMEAIGEQSIIGRPGRTGQASGRTAQSIEYVLTYSGRYDDAEEYENIILRATPEGEILHLSDVAEVELGSEFQSIYSNLDGHPSAAIVLKQNYGSNASEVIDEVKVMLEELERTTFPPGMHYAINYDVSTFLDGIVGRLMVRRGSLLEEGELLTVLSDTSQVWVYFNLSESAYLAYRAVHDVGDPVPVQLRMANGEMFDQPGVIQTIEADFNNETGTIAFRAGFPNPGRILRHGETGEILLTTVLPQALVIPQAATYQVLDHTYVFVVGDDGVVHAREISVGERLPHIYVVREGLEEGEHILVEGLRQVRDGDVIQPEVHAPEEVLEGLRTLHAE